MCDTACLCVRGKILVTLIPTCKWNQNGGYLCTVWSVSDAERDELHEESERQGTGGDAVQREGDRERGRERERERDRAESW